MRRLFILRRGGVLQGLKPQLLFGARLARLKPCRCYKTLLEIVRGRYHKHWPTVNDEFALP